jgi:hypothetical protein
VIPYEHHAQKRTHVHISFNVCTQQTGLVGYKNPVPRPLPSPNQICRQLPTGEEMSDVWDADCVLLFAYQRDKEAVSEVQMDEVKDVEEEEEEEEVEEGEESSGHCPVM